MIAVEIVVGIPLMLFMIDGNFKMQQACKFTVVSYLAIEEKRFPAAIEFAKMAIALTPDFFMGYMPLGRAQSESGLHLEAVETFRKEEAIRIRRHEEVLIVESSFYLGKSLYALKKYPEAKRALLQAEAGNDKKYAEEATKLLCQCP